MAMPDLAGSGSEDSVCVVSSGNYYDDDLDYCRGRGSRKAAAGRRLANRDTVVQVPLSEVPTLERRCCHLQFPNHRYLLVAYRATTILIGRPCLLNHSSPSAVVSRPPRMLNTTAR